MIHNFQHPHHCQWYSLSIAILGFLVEYHQVRRDPSGLLLCFFPQFFLYNLCPHAWQNYGKRVRFDLCLKALLLETCSMPSIWQNMGIIWWPAFSFYEILSRWSHANIWDGRFTYTCLFVMSSLLQLLQEAYDLLELDHFHRGSQLRNLALASLRGRKDS